jgi:signal transduction histidine kinase/ActR/RegA family two-component response regulator
MMKPWFRAQPIHRKLVLVSMAKTTVVLFAAMLLLLVLDAIRFQTAARADAQSLAEMVAENSRAAVSFGDDAATSATLSALRWRAQVIRGCAYDGDGRLIAEYLRAGASCPPHLPIAFARLSLAGTAPVIQSGVAIGHVYVERDWETMRARLIAAGWTSLVILILAAVVMYFLSSRLHGNISKPIGELALAVRQIGKDGTFDMPPIQSSDDEVGELVTAFGAMAARVRSAAEERERLLVRERETNRIKDEFLATVSHELRTPLNAIVGWSQILVTSQPDQETVAKAAASLHRNAQAQARVIDDLIDISRIVTGKLRVSSEPLDLRTVVESAVEAIRPDATHHGTTIRMVLPATTCVISGDRDRLRQIIWNLLSNAVKFAPGGEVTVTVTEDQGQVVVTVSDDGVGIAKEFLPHVFDRFRQADSSITRTHGGLGIGLAVVKELVELHGGVARVESLGRGKGASFTVSFPCVDTTVPCESADEQAPSLAGCYVLAVDDNADTRELLQTLLTDAGARVRVAASGEEALDIWEREPADVVLCDLAMPGMSGFQVLARIRELDRKAGRVTPAIAVTAHASEEQIARSAQAGFQHHIAKPFNNHQLVRVIHTARRRV